MEREKVESKLIRSLAYDGIGTLEIEFHSGQVYKYFAVPPEEAQALLSAKSLGSHFLSAVKGKYETRKVEPDEAEVSIE